jgi:hypothetical protein
LTHTGSKESFEVALDWLGKCQKEHYRCKLGSPEFADKVTGPGGRFPSRIIDLHAYSLETPDAALIPFPGLGCPYATLSYCWGQVEERGYVTTSSMVEGGKVRRLVFNEMPATIQHAFEIAWRVGFRYLWVDAICIVQDSREDWHKEAVKMGWIYCNSALTIAADYSWNVTGGCFNWQSAIQAKYFKETVEIAHHLDDGTRASLWFFSPHAHGTNPIIKRLIGTTALSQRGWAFQEQALSPRVLHYTRDQIIWECREAYHTEDNIPIVHSEWKSLQTLSGSIFPLSQHGNLRELSINAWYMDIACVYSRRKFTFWTDRTAAISGIARIMATRIDSEYLGGTWMRGIEFGLSWSRWGKNHQTGTERLPGPSFSWLMLLAPVFWSIKPGGDIKSYITLLSHSKKLTREDPFSDISAAVLKLKCRLIPSTIRIVDTEFTDLLTAGHGIDTRVTGGSAQVEAKLFMDTNYMPKEFNLLLLAADSEDITHALMVERVVMCRGICLWKRIGLACFEAPTSWIMGDRQTVNLI